MDTGNTGVVEGRAGGRAAWEDVCRVPALVDLVDECLFVTDEALRIVLANRAFLEMFGKSALDEVAGATLGTVAACRIAAQHACCSAGMCSDCGWLQAVATCTPDKRGDKEFRILTCGGEALDFHVRVYAAKAIGATAPLYLCSLRDTFAKKRLRVLERTFFHDVMNLASGVRGLCEMLVDPDAQPEEGLLPMICESSQKLVEEIERLRTLRGAETGDLRTWVSDVSPAAVARAVVDRFREEAQSRHLHVVVQCDGPVADVKTDRDLLLIALGDLFRNAVEASSRGDRVVLGCAEEKERVVFSVCNPQPLSQEVRWHIFERSFTTKGTGRGVGAYRAKLIAERYLRGTAWFDSQEPEGTTFHLALPREAGCSRFT